LKQTFTFVSVVQLETGGPMFTKFGTLILYSNVAGLPNFGDAFPQTGRRGDSAPNLQCCSACRILVKMLAVSEIVLMLKV